MDDVMRFESMYAGHPLADFQPGV